MNPGQQISLTVLFTLLLPFIGSSVAAILEQNHFNQTMNDLIAWAVLIACAVINGFLSHSLTLGLVTGGNLQTLVSVIAGIVSLLVSGPLHSFTPWLNWRDFLRSNLFDILQPKAPVVQAPQFQVPTPRASVTSNAYQGTGTSSVKITPPSAAEPDQGG